MSNLPSSTVSPIVFIVKYSSLQGRLDAEYTRALLTIRVDSKYPKLPTRQIASSKTGGTPSKSRPEYWEGDIPWASPKDFSSFYLSRTEDHISKNAVLDSATALVAPGTLLIVFRSGILQHSLPVTITCVETAINQDLKAFLFCSDVSAEYVAAYFVVFGSRLLPLITKSGATVQSINTEQFDKLQIPVPPKHIQESVVTILLAAYRAKQEKDEQAERLLATLDDVLLEELGITWTLEPVKPGDRIFLSTLSKVSGARWDPNYYLSMGRFLEVLKPCAFPLRKLKECIAIVQYGISERATAEVIGVPILRMLNLQDGGWDLADMKYIATDDHERRAYLLRSGDILFNRTNSKELVGKCNVFDLQGDFVFASYLMRVRLKNECNLRPDYVVIYLGSSLGRLQIDAVSRQIAGMTNVNAEEIRKLLVPFPPGHIQDRICKRVAEIRQEGARLRAQALAELETAKHSVESLILGAAVI